MSKKIQHINSLDSKLKSKVLQLLNNGTPTFSVNYREEKHKAILFYDDDEDIQYLIVINRVVPIDNDDDNDDNDHDDNDSDFDDNDIIDNEDD